MSDFYKQIKMLDKLIRLEEPKSSDYQKLSDLINVDEQLKVYFYKSNTNSKWLKLLYQNNEFFSLLEDYQSTFGSNLRKAEYLLNVTDVLPDEVLDIIGKYPAKNSFVRGKILEILLKVEPVKSVRLTWLIIKYLSILKEADWYYTGEKATQLMVSYSEDYLNESFAIAEKLLEIEKAQDINRIESNFKSHSYKDLLFKFYSKLWNKEPFRAFILLVDVLTNCLDQAKQEDKDISVTLFSERFEDIDDIEETSFYGRKIELMLLKALRDVGRAVLENQPEKVDIFFSYIKKGDYEIFKKFEIYVSFHISL